MPTGLPNTHAEKKRIPVQCLCGPPATATRLKLVLLLAILCSSLLLGYTAAAQKITLSVKNQPLAKVFTEMKRQTGYLFFYDDGELNTSRRITLQLKNASLQEALDACLKGLPFTYSIIEKNILIKPQENKPRLPQPSSPDTSLVLSGDVLNETGLPVPGVSVLIKNSPNGTSTDDEGHFVLKIPGPSAVLELSSLGYAKQYFPVNGQQRVTIRLQQSSAGKLDDVVVVGYGTSSVKDLTGSVTSINGNLITMRKTTQVSQALQGAIPGVYVSRSSAAPGATGTIRIRGNTTLGIKGSGGNDPLIIIDGVPGNIDDMSPDDIDNISVLKDAASAAIYGSRAAAGVILVTTKRTKNNQRSFTYNTDFGFQQVTVQPSFTDAPTYMRLYNEMLVNDGRTPIYADTLINNYLEKNKQFPDLYPNTNWQKDYLSSTAFQHRHSLDISLGANAIRSKVSIGYINQDGLEPQRRYERINLRLNNDFDISPRLKASVDAAYKRTYNHGIPGVADVNGSRIYDARKLPPIYDDYYENGRYAPGKDGLNPIAIVNRGGFTDGRYNQLYARLLLEYTLFKGFKLTGIFAPKLDFNRDRSFSRVVEYGSATNSDNIIVRYGTTNALSEVQGYSQAINSQLLANYSFTRWRDHHFSLLAGMENNTFHSEASNIYRDGFTLPDYTVIDAGSKQNWSNGGNTEESALRSFFGRFKYSYQNKYYLQTNMRYDGSSRFAPGNRWGFFPSVSAGWTVSEEPFLKNAPFSFLKLRVSWGRLGNQNIGGNYPYITPIQLSNSLLYDNAGNLLSVQSAAQTQYAIKDIRWETTETTDLGVDMNFFQNKLSITADYYSKRTYGILLQLPVANYIGLGAPFQNAGRLNNKGWELQAGWSDHLGKDIQYNISVNVYNNRNKVVDLKGISTLDDQAIMEGQEMNVWYGYKALGYFQSTEEIARSATMTGLEKPGDIKYQDMNNDGKITPDKDRVVLGTSQAHFVYGGNLGLTVKNFDFGCSFYGVGSRRSRISSLMSQPFVENYGNVPAYLVNNYWTPDRPNAQYPRLTYANRSVNYVNSDFWLFNGAYFRIKNITAGYTLPATAVKKMGLKGARVYLTATDLFYLSKFPKGWDPETSSSNYPITTTYLAGISIQF